MLDDVKKDLTERLKKTFDFFVHEMKGVRTGRASPQLLEHVVVDAYGSKMALEHLATVTVQGPQTLSVNVWDQGMVPSVEKAIFGELSLNPVVAGTVMRIQLPELNEERRKELVKHVSKLAEKARVAVRSLRRDVLEKFKKAEKDKEISEDDLHIESQKVEKEVSECVKKIDFEAEKKEKELLKI